MGWMWWLGSVGRVEAVCSLLLQGTRPRSASDTLMSRRNIPASPPLPSPPSLWCEVGCVAARQGCEPRAARCGKSVRERGGGNTRVRYRRQLAKIEYWVEGIAVTPYGRSERLPAGSRQEGFSTTMRARTAQLYLPEATSGCPSSARAGAPVGAKEVYSAPAFPLHNRGTHPARRLKILTNVQLTTQLC